MTDLSGKTIILGVSGGIAVYKAVELLRLLSKAGAEVHVVMTKAATEFVTPLTFQTLSHNPVHTELFNLIQEQEIGHISLADRADLFLIAPATANIIGKVAGGIADDLLTSEFMCRLCDEHACPDAECPVERAVPTPPHPGPLHDLADLFQRGHYRREAHEGPRGGLLDEPGEGGLTAAGRAPEDGAREAVFFEGLARRRVGAQDFIQAH